MIYISLLVLLMIIVIILIYPSREKIDFSPFLNKDYAHRGLHDNTTDAPENSMLAFQQAISNGYGIEFDVQLSKDAEVVICHDEDLGRVCGVDKPIAQLTYVELQQYRLFQSQEKIPRCIDLLNLVNNQVPLIVEIKSETKDVRLLCEKVTALLDNYTGPFMVESFNPLVVHYFKKYRPQFIRGQLSGGLSGKKSVIHFLIRHLLTNCITKPHFIAYEQEYQQRMMFNVIRYISDVPLIVYTTKSQQDYDNNRKKFILQIFEGFYPKK